MKIGNSASFTDITDHFADGKASLTPLEVDSVFGSSLPDGDHEIEVKIGEEGSRIEFVLTVDRLPPTLVMPSSANIAADGPEGTPAENEAISLFLAEATATDLIDDDVTVMHNAPVLFPLGDALLT